MSNLYVNSYVHDLIDDNLDFPTFVLRCARSFGALAFMRDDSTTTEIPDEVPQSSYYSK